MPAESCRNHWQDILRETRVFDVIVPGAGEDTIVTLMQAMENGLDLSTVRGIAYRDDKHQLVETQPTPDGDEINSAIVPSKKLGRAAQMRDPSDSHQLHACSGGFSPFRK